MLFKLKNKIVIEKLIKKLKLSCKLYVDKNHIVNNLSSIKYSNSNSLSFIEDNDANKYKYKKGVIISSKIYPFFKNQIITKNPRFLFCKIVDLFFSKQLQAKNYPLKNFREFYLKKKK